MTREETRRVLEKLDGVHRLASSLLYGSGLRILECLRLRVKDVDFEGKQIVVRRGKGDKDRVTLFPDSVREPLRLHLQLVERQHERDRANGAGYVELPDAIRFKYPRAATQWCYVSGPTARVVSYSMARVVRRAEAWRASAYV